MSVNTESPVEAERKRGISPSERWLLLYALLGGVACKHAFYDGTARGLLNTVGVFVAGAFAMAVILSHLESRVRERRARMTGAEHRSRIDVERSEPPISPLLIWGRRLVFVVVPAVPFVVGWLAHLEQDPHQLSDNFPPRIAFVALVIAGIAGVFAVADFDRRIARAGDAWRAARRTKRHPELVTQRKIVAPPPLQASATTPTHRIHGIERDDRVHRTTADGSRIRRRPPGRARVHSIFEWALVGYCVLGFPTMLYLFEGPSGLVAFPVIGFILLAVTNRVDTWASEPIWTPGNETAEDRKRHSIERGRAWLAVAPPNGLRIMRGAFLTLTVVGFCVCLIWPFLQGWAPDEKYPWVATYFAGFSIGLVALGIAERRQIRLERRWLDERESERSAR
jgi:hypothetical protein